MRLSSKSSLNIGRAILIYLIDLSIIITCIGQTADYSPSNYSVDNLDNALIFSMAKHQQQITTQVSVPAVLHKNSTTIHTRRRRRKNRRNKRKRRKGAAISTSEIERVQADESRTKNETKAVTPGEKKKKKRRGRKFKKRRNNKSHTTDNDISEITTSRGKILHIGTNTKFTEMIETMNENPEASFDEYKDILANKSFSSGGFFLANLVGPIPIPPLNNSNSSTLLFKGSNQHEVNNIKKYHRCRKHTCAHICHADRPVKCSCLEGFHLAKDGKSCIDINECKINNGGCENKCINILGSYECRCPRGLRLSDDLKSCEDINECLLRNGHGPCQDTCENTFGHYNCSCIGLRGTTLAADGHSCEDLDECAKDNGGCSHECINTLGRAFCGCPKGMELTEDWRTCQDIDECEDEYIKKTCENGCLNTMGSYHCVGSADLQQDQASVDFVCKPLFPPSKGFIRCSRNNAVQSFTSRGRKRIVNSPGTVCELICPKKYKLSKKYHVMCGADGEWVGEKDGKCLEKIRYRRIF